VLHDLYCMKGAPCSAAVANKRRMCAVTSFSFENVNLIVITVNNMVCLQ
jgi:hypothetical protein